MSARIKLIEPHAESCKNKWWWMPGEVVWRDARGQINTGNFHRWHVVTCNSHRDSDCKGRAWIREDSITALLGDAT
jgi:hypothetical protein